VTQGESVGPYMAQGNCAGLSINSAKLYIYYTMFAYIFTQYLLNMFYWDASVQNAWKIAVNKAKFSCGNFHSVEETDLKNKN
jgi:hypothetical protein